MGEDGHPAAGDEADHPAAGDKDSTVVSEEARKQSVDLGRLGWLVTVVVCLIVVCVLVIEGYLGYAGVTFAVAVAAAINLV